MLYSIHLFTDYPGPIYGDDGYEVNYCGSFSVPCETDDPIVEELHAHNCGLGADERGRTFRAFFTADELEATLERAERETGCYAIERVLHEGVAA